MPLAFTSPAVQSCLSHFTATCDKVIEETLHICRIPAPTFDEAERSGYVADRMRAIGLDDVRIDDLGNVTGILGDGAARPTTLVAAHIDTVFPRHTPLQVQHHGDRLYGPSIGDNSVAVAAMLSIAAAMRRLLPFPAGRVIFAASVGEEGLGNLCGIRRLIETWQGQVDTVIAVEGHGIDELRHAGIGSTRLEVTFAGPGGHSWGAFGTPSAIHAMGSAIHHLSHLQVSKSPKTTFNVGIVDGGGSVNTIAPQARMLVDLRSVDSQSLLDIERRVASILETTQRQSGVEITSTVVGQRPAAALPVEHPLCQGVSAVRQQLGLITPKFTASSTDANWPLSLGIPAICLGITRGGLAHTVNEYIDTTPVLAGIQQLFLAIVQTLHTKSA